MTNAPLPAPIARLVRQCDLDEKLALAVLSFAKDGDEETRSKARTLLLLTDLRRRALDRVREGPIP
jgi:hypothetical protein